MFEEFSRKCFRIPTTPNCSCRFFTQGAENSADMKPEHVNINCRRIDQMATCKAVRHLQYIVVNCTVCCTLFYFQLGALFIWFSRLQSLHFDQPMRTDCLFVISMLQVAGVLFHLLSHLQHSGKCCYLPVLSPLWRCKLRVCFFKREMLTLPHNG